MKTVMDAVNEFKGIRPSNLINRNGWAYAWKGESPLDAYNFKGRLVCTFEQFNTLVQECMTNFGISSIKHLAIWQAGLNESRESKVDYTSEEFWKDAPEGTTHYLPLNGCFSECWVKNLNSLNYDFMPIVKGRINDWENSVSIIKGELDGLVERPKPQPKESNIKPVFTQEMSDNGELPSVGMEYRDGVVLVDMDADGMYVVQEAGVSIICALSGIKPLPTPIVLIDGCAYQFESSEYGGGLGFYSFANNRFICGGYKIQANTCTNIIKLVPEAKV